MLHEHRCHRFMGRFLVGGVLLLAAGAAFVMLLWNALLPPLLAVHAVSYWQALGLLVLARLLLGRGPRPWARGVGRCRSGRHADETGPEPEGAVAP